MSDMTRRGLFGFLGRVAAAAGLAKVAALLPTTPRAIPGSGKTWRYARFSSGSSYTVTHHVKVNGNPSTLSVTLSDATMST